MCSNESQVCVLHRSESLLQPTDPEQDCRDIQCFLRESFFRSSSPSGRLRGWTPLHMSSRRHSQEAALHPFFDLAYCYGGKSSLPSPKLKKKNRVHLHLSVARSLHNQQLYRLHRPLLHLRRNDSYPPAHVATSRRLCPSAPQSKFHLDRCFRPNAGNAGGPSPIRHRL